MKRELGVLRLLATIFFCVSGGPFGLETVVQSGKGLAILLIVLMPIVWATPAALMTAELSSAMPSEGGYYVWVKRALGPMPAFLCAWWTWVYSWVDCAIYPVLFAEYVAGLATLSGHAMSFESHPWLKWLIGMSAVVPLTLLNIRGARPVGETAVLFGLALLAPFVVMVFAGVGPFVGHATQVLRPFTSGQSTAGAAVSAGLVAVMWNYLGWDSMSTVAGEVRDPQRTFPKALALGVPLITTCYLLPVLVGLVAMPDVRQWDDGSWPKIAAAVGGRALGITVASVGLLSAAGQFCSVLLSSSRIPFVMAEDGFLPLGLTRLHPRHGTPWVAILTSALFYSVFSFSSFKDLAVVDVILYSAGILLEFAALVALRKREPDLPRPYRIPGGGIALALTALFPASLVLFAFGYRIHEQGISGAWMCLAALMTGPVMWMFAKRPGKPRNVR